MAAPRVYRDRVEPRWAEDGNGFWYRLEVRRDVHRYKRVDVSTGQPREAFDHGRLASALSSAWNREVHPDRLMLDELSFLPAANGGEVRTIRFRDADKGWFEVDLEHYGVRSVTVETAPSETASDTPPQRRPDPSRGRRRGVDSGIVSPDGRWSVRLHGHNLVLRDVNGRTDHVLTHDGHPGHTYAADARRRRLVEMDYGAQDPDMPRPEILWAPDSSRFVAMRTRPGTERTVYMVASSPEDQLQPELESYPYLKPGDEMPVRKPHLFDVVGRKEIPVSDDLFANPWSISQLRWDRDSSRFTFLFNQRGHQVLRVLAVDARSGGVTPVIEEKSDTFVHYSGKFFYEYLEETREMLWMSERSGWNHLYVFDADGGGIRHRVTRGDWLVTRVDRVDPESRQIWFRAVGLDPGRDPYHVHHARVDFDGNFLVRLTEGDGTHTIQFSPDGRHYLDVWSRVDLPPVTELRRSVDGSLVCEVERADASEWYRSGWVAPERFVARGRDGETEIHGIIHRPRNMDPGRRYPVIESIYAGPHDSHVPKSFRVGYRWETLKDLGFVLVQIDGMGTANRSKAFHDVCWRNLGDAGFPDRIPWMQAAAEERPWMDLDRVGIYGGSAGGQNAMRALLAHGDFYKAAAADCGCHDNRMDKIWWNEQWMGWPVGPHYEESSNVVHAHRLQGKLLLTVGELDRNVDPASTMQVVDALIRADKEFELIVFPGKGHGAGGSPYGERRRNEFFQRHLGGPR